ncbi:MAG: hypothetical protein IJV56_00545 [Neisseriaceae bacterium]|nr:hypothetical protein [Neisseriaceae bacterium]
MQFQKIKHNWKIISISLFSLLCVCVMALYYISCQWTLKEVTRYCIDEQCISVVHLYKPNISGGLRYTRIYKDRIFFRFQLERNNYIEFPALEETVLVSSSLLNGQFIILSDNEFKIHGNVDNVAVVKDRPLYFDTSYISTIDLGLMFVSKNKKLY